MFGNMEKAIETMNTRCLPDVDGGFFSNPVSLRSFDDILRDSKFLNDARDTFYSQLH